MATQSQEITQRLPKFQEEYLQNIFESTQNLFKPVSEGGQGLTMPYAPGQIADLSSGQQQAITNALQGVGAYQPYLQQGQQAMGQGLGAVGTGLGAVGTGLGTMGQGLSTVQQGTGGVQQGLTQADVAAQMLGGATYDPTDYQAFMDPYMDDVVQQQYRDIARQGQIQEQNLGAQAVGAGAFGGARQGVAQAEIGRNVMEQQARTGAQLRSSGFAQAQQAAQQAAQQKLQQAGQAGSLAGQYGALGGQMGALGSQIGQIGAATGQLGATAGALGGQAGQIGQGIAGLGQLGQQMDVQDINTLLSTGGLSQQQQQNLYNMAQQNMLAQQGLPFQQISYMSDIFQGVPALQQTTSTTTTPPPSTASQLLGLGIAGIGAAGQAGGFGNLFNMGTRAT